MIRDLKHSKGASCHTRDQSSATHDCSQPRSNATKRIILTPTICGMPLVLHPGEVPGGANWRRNAYLQVVRKVDDGIKKETNKATSRFKLFTEMNQEGTAFQDWSQLVVDGYNKNIIARNALILKMTHAPDQTKKKGSAGPQRQQGSCATWWVTSKQSPRTRKQGPEDQQSKHQ